MSQILDFYKELLPAFGLEDNEDGYISSLTPTGTKRPATIDGKRLVLPTDKLLRNGFGEDLIAFHPLSESLSRNGTSPVQQYLQRAAKANISYMLTTLAINLLEISADKVNHKDIPPKLGGFLKKLSDADKATVTAFTKIISKAVSKNRLAVIYLKNGGSYEGKKVSRLTVIRFLIYNDLLEDEKTTHGVALTKKQRNTLIELFRHMLPMGDDVETYSHGTNNRVAPYLTSFLMAYHNTMSHLNSLVKTFAKPLAINIKPLPLYSVEDLSVKLGKLSNMIPPLSGNIGGIDEEEEVIKNDKPDPVESTPKPLEAKSKTSSDSGMVSIDDFLNSVKPQQQMPALTGYNQMQNPMMPLQQQQVQFNPNTNFQQPQNNFAPASVGLPWENQNTFQQPMQNNNPFQQAIQMGGNSGLGLI